METVEKNNMTKVKLGAFALGAVTGSLVVAAMKDDSDVVKDITSAIVKIATSYYGCKFIYGLFH